MCSLYFAKQYKYILFLFQLKKVQEDLEKEVENLQMERRQLGAYVERTELWWENQGKWKAHVSNAEVYICDHFA